MNPTVYEGYTPAATVAEVVGVSEIEMETKVRPAGWAIPRDMKWDGRRMHYRVASLYLLADTLVANGEADAALRVREFVRGYRAPAARESAETARPVPVERVPYETDLRAGGLARGHASDREALPENWAHAWEDERG